MKSTTTDEYVCDENTDDVWSECYDLWMCAFDNDSEMKRRSEIIHAIHNVDVQLNNVSRYEYERYLGVRNKNVQFVDYEF